jgi:hypothetical protein
MKSVGMEGTDVMAVPPRLAFYTATFGVVAERRRTYRAHPDYFPGTMWKRSPNLRRLGQFHFDLLGIRIKPCDFEGADLALG